MLKPINVSVNSCNHQRRHGNLKNKAPVAFYRSNVDQDVKPAMMVA